MIVSDEKHWSTESYWKQAKSLKDVPTLEPLNVSCSIELCPAPPVSASLIQWIAVVFLVGCLEHLPWKQNILRASESRFCLVSRCLRLYFVLFTSLHISSHLFTIHAASRPGYQSVSKSFACHTGTPRLNAAAAVATTAQRHPSNAIGSFPGGTRSACCHMVRQPTKQNEIRKVILDQPKQLKTTSQTNCHHCP